MRFEVRYNHCKCHPETCCCNPYVVFDTYKQEKVSTHYNRKDAEKLRDRLNK